MSPKWLGQCLVWPLSHFLGVLFLPSTQIPGDSSGHQTSTLGEVLIQIKGWGGHGGQWSDLDLCFSEERATLRENSPSYVNNLEREGVGVGKKTRKTGDRSRINETISKNRGKEEARDKKKGAWEKERGNTGRWRRREGRSKVRVGAEAGNRAGGSQDVASGEELGEQERQAEIQQGHSSHHQGVGSSRLGRPLGGSRLLNLFCQAPSIRTP